jgi:hypothetical protein
MGQNHRPPDSLSRGRSTTSRWNGTNGLPPFSDGLSGLHDGIDRATPISCRAWISVGGPAMVARQLVVDGVLVLLEVSPVRGEARERSTADRGEPSDKVSRKVTTACDVRLSDALTRFIRCLARGSPQARWGECGEPTVPKGTRYGSEGDGWKHRSSCALAVYPTLLSAASWKRTLGGSWPCCRSGLLALVSAFILRRRR